MYRIQFKIYVITGNGSRVVVTLQIILILNLSTDDMCDTNFQIIKQKSPKVVIFLFILQNSEISAFYSNIFFKTICF